MFQFNSYKTHHIEFSLILVLTVTHECPNLALIVLMINYMFIRNDTVRRKKCKYVIYSISAININQNMIIFMFMSKQIDFLLSTTNYQKPHILRSQSYVDFLTTNTTNYSIGSYT